MTERDGAIRVVLADDHAPTREDIRLTLESDGGFVVCAEASDAPGAVDAAVRERPDICLLDVAMPGGGVAAAWEITARLPKTKVVMLTISTEDRDLLSALKAGAAGYLLKDIDPAELPHELARVVDGDAALAPALVGRVITELRDRSARRRSAAADGREAQLTSREWQILDLLRHGFSTSEIARRLVLSPVTVRTHANSIMKKLHVRDRDELVRHFRER
ncbi:MAG: response regulator transcription factor [Actinomycetota bacterium]|nr:response regulator transcription factor [Actinomycetota bacterium]